MLFKESVLSRLDQLGMLTTRRGVRFEGPSSSAICGCEVCRSARNRVRLALHLWPVFEISKLQHNRSLYSECHTSVSLTFSSCMISSLLLSSILAVNGEKSTRSLMRSSFDGRGEWKRRSK